MAWPDDIPATLTFDNGGTPAPVREHPFVKESPDLGHFVNRALGMHREFGARLPATAKDDAEREAWRKNHLPKLYDAGILPKPPAAPEEYEIKKPEALPAGLLWDDARATKLAQVLHKHGVPKAAVPELLELHTQALVGGQTVFKTDFDTAASKLKSEFGDKFEERYEQAKRLLNSVITDPAEWEFLDRSGLGNHPRLLSWLMRLAPLAQQDRGMGNQSGASPGSPNADSVRAELADIMSNPANPRHKLYWSKDPATMAYIDDLYKKSYGTGQVTIS